MKKITEANFKPEKIEVLGKGLRAKMQTTVALEGEDTSVTSAILRNKDDAHAELHNAFQKLVGVIGYDEGLEDVSGITPTGIQFKKDSVKLFHSRVIQSGEPTRESAWIALDDDSFEKLPELKEAVEAIKHQTFEYFINYKRANPVIDFEAEAA